MKPPRGTHDLLPNIQCRHQYIIEKARQISQRFGCGEIATPIFLKPLRSFKEPLANPLTLLIKRCTTFQDRSGSLLTLRPEGTAEPQA